MKRLILVYNPRSSRYPSVQREVISRATKLNGYLIGKYEVAPTNIDDNIKRLSQIISDRDLVLAVGGDATGVIAANAILKSGKDAKLAALPYGNFNDLSRTLGVNQFEKIFSPYAKTKTLYPLEIRADGKLIRYSTCYITIGMTAESVEIYDEPKMRKKLRTNFGRRFGSYTTIAKWYFKKRNRKVYLPKFQLNNEAVPAKTSDYVAVNGRYLARVMRGGFEYLHPKTFRSNTYCLTSFWKLCKMMIVSIFCRVPSSETQDDILKFTKPSNITIQAEGESISLKNTSEIEIKKADKHLKVIVL